MAILISCETAGALLPEAFFAGADAREFAVENGADQVDLVGFEIAERVADRLGTPLVRNPTRLDLIDVTRSLRHPNLLGVAASGFSAEQKRQLIEMAYTAYFGRVREEVSKILQEFTFAVHLSFRTFDPNLGGKRRRTDVGLLYDATRFDEVDFCVDWIDQQYDVNPNVRMRRNYPRRGTSNHLHKVLRQQFPADHYLGIDVWMNRAWAARDVRLRDEAIESLCESLRVTIGFSPALEQQADRQAVVEGTRRAAS